MAFAEFKGIAWPGAAIFLAESHGDSVAVAGPLFH
jgi:hypothetical protein